MYLDIQHFKNYLKVPPYFVDISNRKCKPDDHGSYFTMVNHI